MPRAVLQGAGGDGFEGGAERGGTQQGGDAGVADHTAVGREAMGRFESLRQQRPGAALRRRRRRRQHRTQTGVGVAEEGMLRRQRQLRVEQQLRVDAGGRASREQRQRGRVLTQQLMHVVAGVEAVRVQVGQQVRRRVDRRPHRDVGAGVVGRRGARQRVFRR